MQDAIDACHKAGIGLIAMKTQSMRQRRGPADANAAAAEAEADKKMLAHFLEKGFTEGQAKIKAVMDDQRISTVCSSMTSTALLMTNIAVALDKPKLAAFRLSSPVDSPSLTWDSYPRPFVLRTQGRWPHRIWFAHNYPPLADNHK